MKRKQKVIIGVLCACIVCFGALFAVSRLVAPKYHDSLEEGHLTGEYYRETTAHDVLFVGDDWYKSESWQATESKFKEVGVRVIYFPYTKGISTTLITHALRTLKTERSERSEDFYTERILLPKN